MYATGSAQVEVVRFLVESGADINRRGRKGGTVLLSVKGNIRTCRNLDSEIAALEKHKYKQENIDKFRQIHSPENLKKWEEILIILNQKTMDRFFRTAIIYTFSVNAPDNIDSSSKDKYLKEELDWKKLEKGFLLQWQYFPQYIIFPKGSELQVETSFPDGTEIQEIFGAIENSFSGNEKFFRHSIAIKGASIIESFTAREHCVMLTHRMTLICTTVVTAARGEIMASNIMVSSKNSPCLIDEVLDLYVTPRVVLSTGVSGKTSVYRNQEPLNARE